MPTPFELVRSRLEARGHKLTKSGGQWKTTCPAHDDHNPSLSIGEAPDGTAKLHCFVGCSSRRIAELLDLPMSVLFPHRETRSAGGEIEACYPYHDEKGVLLFEVVRLRPKSFYQRRPDGNDGWIKDLKGVRRVLYRLPEVLAEKELVYVVEGEDDADRLASRGLTATTNPMGAGKWRDEYTQSLSHVSKVVVIADRDEPGRRHAANVAASLLKQGIEAKAVVPPNHKDVSEHLDAGLELEDLVPLEEAPASEPDPSGTDTELRFTDTDNSRRLAGLHGERLRYVHAWGVWLVWDDGRWVGDPKGVLVGELAKDVSRELYRQLADLPVNDGNRKLRDEMAKWAKQSASRHLIDSMVRLTCGIDGILIDHNRLDADPWALGVENGWVDLHDQTFHRPDPAKLMTLVAGTQYQPGAKAPLWEKALGQWLPDPDHLDYFHRLCGAALVGQIQDHHLVIISGPGGNGKGTALGAIATVLGDYYVVPHKSLLVVQHHEQHATVKASLFRRRLAVAAETEERVHLNEAQIKELTGGDQLTARKMYENEWKFTPTHHLWLQTNHLPQISGTDWGIWRRIKVLPWLTTFVGSAEDRELPEKLRAEAPGILNWLLEGVARWRKVGLGDDTVPAAVREATDSYRQAEDEVARWLEAAGLRISPELRTPASELHESWQKFCDDILGVSRRFHVVAKALVRMGCKSLTGRTRAEGKRVTTTTWHGIGFGATHNDKAEANDTAEAEYAAAEAHLRACGLIG